MSSPIQPVSIQLPSINDLQASLASMQAELAKQLKVGSFYAVTKRIPQLQAQIKQATATLAALQNPTAVTDGTVPPPAASPILAPGIATPKVGYSSLEIPIQR